MPDNAYRINQVSLESVGRDEAGDLIATLFYVAAEHLDGQYDNPHLYDTRPFVMRGSFIGLGEFYVEKGYWKRFTGQLIGNAIGPVTSPESSANLYVLEEMKP